MRCTALIRQILELELLEEQVAQQKRILRQQLREGNISILERDNRALDIWVQYKWNGRLYEAVYMRAMLDAVVQGVFQEWRKGKSS